MKFKVGDKIKFSDGEVGTIVNLEEEGSKFEPYIDWCVYSCGNEDCVEWVNVLMDDGTYAYHVAECRVTKA